MHTNDLTPVQSLGPYLVKRDDLFEVAGVRGGKVRTCLILAESAKAHGAVGLITAGSKDSPQVNIVAHIGHHLGLKVRGWTNKVNDLGPELLMAESVGAEIVRCGSTYINAAEANANNDPLLQQGWTLIPFGMECDEAVTQTRTQVANLVGLEIKRLVMPVGSGMSAAGVLHGLADHGLLGAFPVIGVRTGRDPSAMLDRYAPTIWRQHLQLVDSGQHYKTPASVTTLEGLDLDPYYEAKCIPFIEPGDLLWVIGIRRSSQTGIVNAAPAPHHRATPTSLTLLSDPADVAALTDVTSVLAWVEASTPSGTVGERLRVWASWDASYRSTRERMVTSVRLLMGRDLTSAAASGKLQKDISTEHGIGERQLRYYLAAWAAVDGKTLPVEVLDRPIPDIPHAVAHFLTTGTLDDAPVPSRKAQERHNKKTQPAPPPAPLSPTPKPDRPLNVVSRRSKEVEDAMNGVTDWTARTTPRGMVWATPRLLSVALHYYGTKGSEAMPQTDDERGKIEALVDPVHGDTEVRAALSALAALIAAKVANDA